MPRVSAVMMLMLLPMQALFVLFATEGLAQSLRVHDSHRYLVDDAGRPYFWLGDTAWELIHRLDREQTQKYLKRRSEQRFNVVQTVLLAEFDGLNTPNAYGHIPLLNRDPTRPDIKPEVTDDYWDHADFVVDEAAKLGMVVALLPTWGEWVTPRFSKPAIFQDPEQGYAYGRFLGERYRTRKNIVWILGGDRPADEQPHAIGVWRAMAEGLADGRNGNTMHDGQADWSTTLISFHSMTSCSKWFQKEAWIDFNMWGTYHTAKDWPRSFQVAEKDYALVPIKPTLNSEPPYEEHPHDYDPTKGWFEDFEIRRAAWWSVMSGTMGHTYGAHPIWQFYDGKPAPPSKVPVPDVAKPRITWTESLSLPVGNQMQHVRALFESVDFTTYSPKSEAFSIRAQTAMEGLQPNRLAGGFGIDYAFIYSPMGESFAANLDSLRSDSGLIGSWYDPKSGQSRQAGNLSFSPDGVFDPPGEPGLGNDWVLVVRKKSK
jgi:Protein of unknown function (DUF4038)/Putative collagen-binding domain of a collagenase